ncbi:rCG33789 [Rattus norvegicus]|uniref:RCG33789 n=1 Tax=Rattus norvegicus TaxID=10116 RepID=A6HJM5_RAT|nr:rCG33789 [Rattus norvegicus]
MEAQNVSLIFNVGPGPCLPTPAQMTYLQDAEGPRSRPGECSPLLSSFLGAARSGWGGQQGPEEGRQEHL